MENTWNIMANPRSSALSSRHNKSMVLSIKAHDRSKVDTCESPSFEADLDQGNGTTKTFSGFCSHIWGHQPIRVDEPMIIP